MKIIGYGLGLAGSFFIGASGGAYYSPSLQHASWAGWGAIAACAAIGIGLGLVQSARS